MAFVKKTWQPRVSEFPTRRLLTNVLSGTQTRYTVERDEGVISAEGDSFSATNMNNLESRIESGIISTAQEIVDAKVTYGITDLTEGVSPLTTGTLYIYIP